MKYNRINSSFNPLSIVYINDIEKLIISNFNGSNPLNLFVNNEEYSTFDSYFYNFIELFKKNYKFVIDSNFHSNNDIGDAINLKLLDRLKWVDIFSKKYNIPNNFLKIWVSTLDIDTDSVLYNLKKYDGEYSYSLYKYVIKDIKLFENKNYNMVMKPYDSKFNVNRKFDKKALLLFNNTWSSYNMYSIYISAMALFESDMVSNFNVAKTLIRSKCDTISNINLDGLSKNNALNLHNVDNYQDVIKTTFINIVTIQYLTDGAFDYSSTYSIPHDLYYSINNFQPFLFLGRKHHLKKLKEIGFKTFDKWWDESYDNEEYVIDRTAGIISILNIISKKSYNELKTIYLEMQDVLQHNYELSHQLKNEYNSYYLNSRISIIDFNDYDDYLL